MASVNKVILVGNLGRDPESRSMPSGGTVCNVALATSRKWKTRDTGDTQEETEWHRVVFFDRLGEIAAQYLKKGSSVYVEGRLKTRKWTDKDGIEKYSTEIVAEQMQMLGSREGMGGGNDAAAYEGGGGGGGGGERTARPAQRSPAPAARSAPSKSSTGFDDMEDDIPF